MSARGSSRRLALVGLVMLFLGTGCLTSTIGISVGEPADAPPWARLTVTQTINGDYVRAAQAANAELQADLAAAGRTWDESMDLPETIDELLVAAPDLALVSDDTTLTLKASSIRSRSYETTMPLSELQATMEASRSDDGGGMLLTRRMLPGTEQAVYVWRLVMPPSEEPIDWAGWDQAMAARPAKPVLRSGEAAGDASVALEGEAGRAMALSGFDRILEGLFAAASFGTDIDELRGWYAMRVMREAGFPSLRIEVDLPGFVQEATVNGIAGGTQLDAGDAVAFDLNEAFWRRNEAKGFTLMVVSLYDVPRPGQTLEDDEVQTTEDTSAARPSGRGATQFRVRLRWFFTVTIAGVGHTYARYTIEELDGDRRRATLHFHARGVTGSLPQGAAKGFDYLKALAKSISLGAGFSPHDSTTTLTVRHGRLRLEDWHEKKGTVANLGGFLGGYGKITLGLPGDIQVEGSGPTWTVGPWAALGELSIGEWTIER